MSEDGLEISGYKMVLVSVSFSKKRTESVGDSGAFISFKVILLSAADRISTSREPVIVRSDEEF